MVILGDQVYTSVIVKGNFSGIIETEKINNISSLANHTSLNKPQNLTNLSLKNVTGKYNIKIECQRDFTVNLSSSKSARKIHTRHQSGRLFKKTRLHSEE